MVTRPRVFPLDWPFAPIENEVVPHSLFVAVLLLLISKQIELCGVEPPGCTLPEALIRFSPKLVTIATHALHVNRPTTYGPESAISGRVNEWLLIVRGRREHVLSGNIQSAAPMPRSSSAKEPTSGQYDGCGTK